MCGKFKQDTYEFVMGSRNQGKTIATRNHVHNVLMQILQDTNLKSIVINGVAIKFKTFSFDKEKIYLFLKDENEKVIASVPLTSIKTVY